MRTACSIWAFCQPLPLARQCKPVPACLQALSNESLSSTSWPDNGACLFIWWESTPEVAKSRLRTWETMHSLFLTQSDIEPWQLVGLKEADRWVASEAPSLPVEHIVKSFGQCLRWSVVVNCWLVHLKLTEGHLLFPQLFSHSLLIALNVLRIFLSADDWWCPNKRLTLTAKSAGMHKRPGRRGEHWEIHERSHWLN